MPALAVLVAALSNSAAVLYRIVLAICVPAVTLLQLDRIELNANLILPASMAWLTFGLGLLAILAAPAATSSGTRGAWLLTAGLANTSFMGYPLIEALRGHDALATAVVVDQLGSFLLASTGAVIAAERFSARAVDSRRSSPSSVARILKFPPFLALLFAIGLRVAGFHWGETGREIFRVLSAPLAPLALFAVGLTLRLSPEKIRARSVALAAGLGFRLLLAPLLLTGLYVGLGRARDETVQITLLESAMAPMITGAILAGEFGLDPELASLMVALGVPLSLVTVPLWSMGLRAWLG